MVNKKKQKKNKTKQVELPFVSICTPTYNRRPFFEGLIKCFQNQNYPKDKMEWIIVDDGIDKIEDLVENIEQVKYISLEEKVNLGKKRNMMHEMAIGDIIVYMDDDDYYPPDRVSHAVDSLIKNKKYMIAGSSILYIYFNDKDYLYKFGPYGKYHSTAATFAFKKELLKDCRFNDEACLAEEKTFLKNYSIPLLQLDPLKTILVLSHEQNTFDKRTLIADEKILESPNSKITISANRIEKVIKNKEMLEFYGTTIFEKIKDYEYGKMEYKQDVIEYKEKLDKERSERTRLEQMKNIKLYRTVDNKKVEIPYYELVDIIQNLNKTINNLKNENKMLQEQVNNFSVLSTNNK